MTNSHGKERRSKYSTPVSGTKYAPPPLPTPPPPPLNNTSLRQKSWGSTPAQSWSTSVSKASASLSTCPSRYTVENIPVGEEIPPTPSRSATAAAPTPTVTLPTATTPTAPTPAADVTTEAQNRRPCRGREEVPVALALALTLAHSSTRTTTRSRSGGSRQCHQLRLYRPRKPPTWPPLRRRIVAPPGTR